MAKLNIPSDSFKTELTPGTAAAAIKAAAAAKVGDMLRVPVGAITVLDGYNVRVRDTAAYKEGIQELKNSIAENGFYNDKPLGVYIAKVGDENVIYLRSGHRRLEAVEAWNFEAPKDQQIEALPVVIVPAATTMEEHLVELIQGNSGKDLTPFEKGIVVKRLIGFGMAKADIAKKLGYTPRYIDDLLVIVSAPAAARTLILENKVSSTQALRELRKDPAKAAAALTAMVKAATDKGKAKATASDKGPKLVKQTVEVNFGSGDVMGATLKAAATAIRAAVPHASDDTDLISVSGKLVVTIFVPAPVVEAASPPAAKPKAESKPKAPAKPKADTKKAAAEKTKKAAVAAGLLPGKAPPTDEPDPLAHALGGGEEAPSSSAPPEDDNLADL